MALLNFVTAKCNCSMFLKVTLLWQGKCNRQDSNNSHSEEKRLQSILSCTKSGTYPELLPTRTPGGIKYDHHPGSHVFEGLLWQRRYKP